jgi:iron-sulfur cluster assembly protein
MMSDVAQTGAPAPVPAPAAPKPAVKFGITDAAAARLRKLIAERQTPEAGLRIAVKGGGCSGLAYVLEWAEKPRERDKIAEKDGVRVFIDAKSYLYLMGSELEFEETLMSAGFKIQNPNVKSSCGCGESFTI